MSYIPKDATLPYPTVDGIDGTVIVGLDANGMRVGHYDGWLFYPTECCDAAMDGGGWCKKCYQDCFNGMYGCDPTIEDVVAAYDPDTYEPPIFVS